MLLILFECLIGPNINRLWLLSAIPVVLAGNWFWFWFIVGWGSVIRPAFPVWFIVVVVVAVWGTFILVGTAFGW